MKKILLITILCLFLIGCQQNQLESSPKVEPIKEPVVQEVQQPVVEEVVCNECQKKVGDKCIDYDCCSNVDCYDGDSLTNDICDMSVHNCIHTPKYTQNIKLVELSLEGNDVKLKVCKEEDKSIDGQRSFVFKGDKTYTKILTPSNRLKLCGVDNYIINIPLLLLYDSVSAGQELNINVNLVVDDMFNSNKNDDKLSSTFYSKISVGSTTTKSTTPTVNHKCYSMEDCDDGKDCTVDSCVLDKINGNHCFHDDFCYDVSDHSGSTSFNDCNSDSDCKVSGKAYYCDDGRCRTFTNPQVTVSDLNGFCNAYLSCSSYSTTISYSGIDKDISIEGPGAFDEKKCTLKLTYEGSSVTSGTAGLIANSYESCVNNAPYYFYNSLERNSCCGY